MGIPGPWWLVVPVKAPSPRTPAKSRLAVPPDIDHDELAEALALDTVRAAVAAVGSGRVYCVTSGPRLPRLLAELGARVVVDPHGGLDSAVRAGLAVALADGRAAQDVPADPGVALHRRGRGPIGLGVLLGDLPALTPADLREALSLAAGHPRAVVPDAQGTGTVLLTSRWDAPESTAQATSTTPSGSDPVAALMCPAFGADSAARHQAGGHRRLEPDLPRLRTDVDDTRSLRAAIALGVGPYTSRALGH